MRFLFLIFIIPLLKVNAQRENPEMLIQNLMNQQQEEVSYEEFYENLIQFYHSPINLNTADANDLSQLNLLSPSQIEHLISYRNQTGSILSLYELQTISGYDLTTIQTILPFVTIGVKEKTSSFLTRIKNNPNQFIYVKSDQLLSTNNLSDEMLGDEVKVSSKYRNFIPGDFSLGITVEKDRGEKLYISPSSQYYLFDYSSCHFTLYNRKKVKAFTLGDYHLQFGQGLVFAGAFSLGKAADPILGVIKNTTGIRPHTSATENNFFRGSAITIGTPNFETTVFFSHQKVDGRVNEEENTFSRISTGYHRTLKELEDRRTVRESAMGYNFTARNRKRNLQAGISGIQTWYEKPLSGSDELYKLYYFRGRQNFTGSADIRYSWKNFYFSAESAISSSKGKAIVASIVSSLSSTVETSLLFRNYEKDFHSFYGNAFSEGNQPMNEKGTYLGIKYKPRKDFFMLFYADRFNFPWLRFGTDAPSRGEEYYARFTYLPDKKSVLFAQFKYENKEENHTGDAQATAVLMPVKKYQCAFQAETAALPFIFRFRVQYSNVSHYSKQSSGFVIAQDLEYQHPKFSVVARAALFETDDFDTRQYMYERNIPFTFSVPFYYGQGIRAYCMFRCKIYRSITGWIRYSVTNYFESEYSAKDKGEIFAMIMLKL